VNVLNILIHSQKALSGKEIQSTVTGRCDRATIYRILKKFSHKGLIHSVTEGMIKKFVYLNEKDDHSHFKCETCGEIRCLPDVNITDLQLPTGFTKKEVSMIITGTCSNCNLAVS
jgi:Fur family ferric uptake transcriptional regulator